MTNTENLYANIRAHVESNYPMLYLVTFEEHHADALIRKLAEDENPKIFEWDFARGEVDFKNKSYYYTKLLKIGIIKSWFRLLILSDFSKSCRKLNPVCFRFDVLLSLQKRLVKNQTD